MTIDQLLQICYEDRIRLAFSVLCESLTQGDDDGALRFAHAIRIASNAMAQAVVVFNQPPPDKKLGAGWLSEMNDGEGQ
jgi:hypothetical protein